MLTNRSGGSIVLLGMALFYLGCFAWGIIAINFVWHVFLVQDMTAKEYDKQLNEKYFT